MTEEQLNIIIGRIGECEVANQLNRRGHEVILSVNPYDSIQDAYVDGLSVEIKTQQIYVMGNCFAVDPKQERKLRNVSMNYFVSIPPKYDPNHEAGGKIFTVSPDFESHRFRAFNKSRLGIDLDQPAVSYLCNISSEALREFAKYSYSDYTKVA